MKLKRSASATNGKPGKKHKVEQPKNGKKAVKGKERAADRPIIPVPGGDNGDEEDEEELAEEDLAFFADNGEGGFLASLDKKGILRSKKETKRLHKLNKPVRESRKDEDDLPSIQSHSEDEEDWSSGLEDGSDALSDEDLEVSGSESLDSEPVKQKRTRNNVDSDEELPYEVAGRPRPASPKRTAERLPIKLGNGRIQSTGARAVASESESEEEEPEEDAMSVDVPRGVEDVATGARFGRPAVRDIVRQKSRKARLEGAKEQLATICQEIVAEPENCLGLLRRLHTFALPEIPGAVGQDGTQQPPTPNDPRIRTLALLSQLAVFRDIVPGYRIRALTDHEKAEKVSQMVQRTRDWEQGLVGVYQNYLKLLEAEVKAKSELDQVALRCMCTLLTSITHFNFRANIMASIVARLSKRSWDETSELCSSTLITMLRADNTGASSLEAVRLLNRMVKERRFLIHPRVLSCLLHLRLKTELGVRANRETIDRDDDSTKQERAKKLRKGKKASAKEGQVYLSKKAKKAQKANKEIEAEMAEATAEVDKEERAQQQTETLKLLFVLYFRILKHPKPTPLLPAALEGISRYAHMVNIDFFKDLLLVLKELIERGSFHEAEEGDADEDEPVVVRESEVLRQRLLCISTAFELLSGQGEALNIDLNEFVQHLYNIILPLSLSPDIEVSSQHPAGKGQSAVHLASSSDLLFRALGKVFVPRITTSVHPPWRVAAFTKRLLTAATSFPPASAVRALEFVHALIAKHAQLDALLESDDRAANGVYRPDVDDPQLANAFATSAWEVQLLASHWDSKTREAALKISNFVRS